MLKLRLLLQGNLLSLFLWNLSISHPVILKGPNVLRAIVEREDSMSVLEIFFPFSFVLAAVRIVESAFAVSLAKFPVSDIPVPEQLAVS